jgi:hypothetical protein
MTLKEHQHHNRTTRVDARIAVDKPLEQRSRLRAQPLQSPTHMTEQQNRNTRSTKEQPAVQAAGADDTRRRSVLDDRCKAVSRWIEEDDTACHRSID